jgi:hypothetical protein
MSERRRFIARVMVVGLLATIVRSPSEAQAAGSAEEIVRRLLASDPFGFNDATIDAHLVVVDRTGSKRSLAFRAISRRYAPPESETLLRFSAPPDMAGAGFLQIEHRDADDDRYLFLPELGRSRRIAGSLRSSAFMGTDFAFADLDRRDLREGIDTLLPDVSVAQYACHVVQVVPTRSDSPYSRIVVYVRPDNGVPLKMEMFDRAQVLAKTFDARELRRVDGVWYIVSSRMTNHPLQHTTELVIDQVASTQAASDDLFSVRNLEKP